jgi:hypothetical protein
MLRMNTLDTFKAIDPEDIRGLLLSVAETHPELFSDVVDVMEDILVEECIQEMREETCNGYPMYPELSE